MNWFFERLESQGATSDSALYPVPGVEQIAISVHAPGRAHFFMAGREFAVFGTKLHEISKFGGLTSRGDVAIGEDPATISSNGDGGGQLFVTSGGNGYIFDLGTNVFSQVTALNGKATMGDSLDGYFLALDAATSTFYISALLDGLTWSTGTDFAQRNIASDPWVAMKVNGRYVWLLGEQTSEVWYDTGSGNFPFAPHPSGLIPYGIAAPFSVAVADGMIIWLGASKIGDAYVLRAAGFTPEVVSDYPLQYAFNRYNTINDATADCFNYLGHVFYRLTFHVEKATWCWDAQLGRWFEWMTWISEENRYTAGRAQWHAMAFGEHRMLDSETGALYRMASHLNLDVDGRPIRRLRRAPCLTAELQPIFYAALELDLEPGLGLTSSAGRGILIQSGINNFIPLNIDGTLIDARVAPGLYIVNVLDQGTGSRALDPLSVAILAALNAASTSLGKPVDWTCSYDSTVNRYTLGSIDPSFPVAYLFLTGTNADIAITETLGYLPLDWGLEETKEAENEPITSALQGTSPHVMLRFSNDGGKTWSTEMMRSAGEQGEYLTRVRWNRLGRARRRVFEISVTDPIPWRVADAFIHLGQPLQGAARQQQQAQG